MVLADFQSAGKAGSAFNETSCSPFLGRGRSFAIATLAAEIQAEDFQALTASENVFAWPPRND